MNDAARRSIRQSIEGADRGLRVISNNDGPPPARPGGTPEDDCPVVALGHYEGHLHFLDVTGHKRELSARALGTRPDLLTLFGGDETWLRQHFPKKELVNRKK